MTDSDFFAKWSRLLAHLESAAADVPADQRADVLASLRSAAFSPPLLGSWWHRTAYRRRRRESRGSVDQGQEVGE